MCCHDTNENDRSKYTASTIACLAISVDWRKHRLVVIDNASCRATKHLLSNFLKERIPNVTVITNEENFGTAKAINMGIKLRSQGEHVVKLDNDVYIKSGDWVDDLEEVIQREPSIGIVGLKRKDLCQTPWHTDPDFRSEGWMLPHESGQRWIWVERSKDIMGTCTMLSSKLLDKLGYYEQPTCYGLDDSLINTRSLLAGFQNVFLPHIEIDHLDTGGTEYTEQKKQWAAEAWPIYHEWHKGYCDGTRPLYYDGGYND